MSHFCKKNLEKHLEMSLFYTLVYEKSQWFDLQFLRYRAWQIEIGNFRSLFALSLPWKPEKSKVWKNGEKKCWRYHHLTRVYQKSKSYDICFWDMQSDRNFCHFGSFFALLSLKVTVLKILENVWRYYPFTHLYHKWRSYDVWFLKKKVQQTEFWVIWGYFCSIASLTIHKIEILKKKPGDIIILHVYHKWPSYEWLFLRYGAGQIKCFVILYHFLPFYYTNLENQNFEKMKKCLEILSFYKRVQ